jgi:hypothetical protein
MGSELSFEPIAGSQTAISCCCQEEEDLEAEQGTVFVSMPSLLDPSLAPAGHQIVHTFTPSSIDAWRGLSPTAYAAKKEARRQPPDRPPRDDPAGAGGRHHPPGGGHPPQPPPLPGPQRRQLRPLPGAATAGPTADVLQPHRHQRPLLRGDSCFPT